VFVPTLLFSSLSPAPYYYCCIVFSSSLPVQTSPSFSNNLAWCFSSRILLGRIAARPVFHWLMVFFLRSCGLERILSCSTSARTPNVCDPREFWPFLPPFAVVTLLSFHPYPLCLCPLFQTVQIPRRPGVLRPSCKAWVFFDGGLNPRWGSCNLPGPSSIFFSTLLWTRLAAHSPDISDPSAPACCGLGWNQAFLFFDRNLASIGFFLPPPARLGVGGPGWPRPLTPPSFPLKKTCDANAWKQPFPGREMWGPAFWSPPRTPLAGPGHAYSAGPPVLRCL